MTKKVFEMNQQAESMKNEVQKLLDESKLDEAKAKMQELRALKDAIKLQEELEADEEAALQADASNKIKNKSVNTSANIIRAAIKKVTGHALTEAENNLLLPNTSHTNGENGEAYLLPVDVRTEIQRKIREFKSLREVLGYTPTSSMTGSIPVEGFDSLSGLIDFSDGIDAQLVTDIKFTNAPFSLKEKGAFIKLSNTLINLADEDLIAYIAEVFAKKAVITENNMAIEVLKSNKTKKSLADWKALKHSMTKDLDPAALKSTVIITNQDGFDALDSALDDIGRPILQPNPANLTEKLFNGRKIEVFSNDLMPSEGNNAPIFYGALSYGAKFVDLSGAVAFATSSEAGFLSNTTIARLIEFVDVIQCDKSDKCYVYGEIPIANISSMQTLTESPTQTSSGNSEDVEE